MQVQDWQMLAASIVSGTVTGITAGVLTGWRSMRHAEMRATAQDRKLEVNEQKLDLHAEKIRQIDQERVHGCENRLAKIEDKCTAEQTRVQMDVVTRTLCRIEGKVDDFTRAVATLEAQQANTHAYVSDVAKEFRAHAQQAGR